MYLFAGQLVIGYMFRLKRFFRRWAGQLAASGAADAVMPLGRPSIIRNFDATRIRSPRIAEFHGLWDGLRGDRAAPARADFGPEDFRSVLPHLFLVEVEQDDLFRFAMRLVGTELERQLGGLAGRKIEPVPRDRWAGTAFGAYANCAITLRPVYDFVRARLPDGAVGEFERLILPISGDGASATHLIGCAVFAGSFTLRDSWCRSGGKSG